MVGIKIIRSVRLFSLRAPLEAEPSKGKMINNTNYNNINDNNNENNNDLKNNNSNTSNNDNNKSFSNDNSN